MVGCGWFLVAGRCLAVAFPFVFALLGLLSACSFYSVCDGWGASLLARTMFLGCFSVWVCSVGAVCACSFYLACVGVGRVVASRGVVLLLCAVGFSRLGLCSLVNFARSGSVGARFCSQGRCLSVELSGWVCSVHKLCIDKAFSKCIEGKNS